MAFFALAGANVMDTQRRVTKKNITIRRRVRACMADMRRRRLVAAIMSFAKLVIARVARVDARGGSAGESCADSTVKVFSGVLFLA